MIIPKNDDSQVLMPADCSHEPMPCATGAAQARWEIYTAKSPHMR
jgi:hypothetical protein